MKAAPRRGIPGLEDVHPHARLAEILGRIAAERFPGFASHRKTARRVVTG